MTMLSTSWRYPEPLELRYLLSIASETSALETYVAAMYQDVLRRPIDPGTKVAMASRLQQGDSVFEISNEITHSREHFADVIQSVYGALLGRGTDALALDYWLGLNASGLTDERLEARILASDEFYARVGGTDGAFVGAIYRTLLGRPADAAGEAYWLEQLKSGSPRFQISFAFAQSQEREQLRVQDDYLQIFHRHGDENGIAFWTNQLVAGTSNGDVLTGLVVSHEYFALRTGQPITAVPISSSFAWWQSYEDQINVRARQGNADLLFLGDSQVAYWTSSGFGQTVWQQSYGARSAMAAGMPGDTTQGVLWTLIHSDLKNLRPKLTVVEVGTNNLTTGDSPTEVVEGIKAIVGTLRDAFPETKILLMGIFPRGASAPDPVSNTVTATNSLIRGLADDQNVYYVDISSALRTANGVFMPGSFHLTPAGYQIWAESIEPVVKATLG